MIDIRFGDNLDLLKEIESESIDLIYIDPPFNTGKTQRRISIKTVHDDEGERVGFQGKHYKTETLGIKSYNDVFSNFIEFLEPRMQEAYRVLKKQGALYFHIDYREVHYCKILLDQIFGRDSFLNEIHLDGITDGNCDRIDGVIPLQHRTVIVVGEECRLDQTSGQAMLS